jgi:hypothetical protein
VRVTVGRFAGYVGVVLRLGPPGEMLVELDGIGGALWVVEHGLAALGEGEESLVEMIAGGQTGETGKRLGSA